MDCLRPLGSIKALFFSLLCPHVSCRRGKFCNCSESASAMDSSLCKGPGITESCSGRGDCECGTCVCYNPDQFEGPYCQYDKTQCQRFGGFLCNGMRFMGAYGYNVFLQILWILKTWALYIHSLLWHTVSLCNFKSVRDNLTPNKYVVIIHSQLFIQKQCSGFSQFKESPPFRG